MERKLLMVDITPLYVELHTDSSSVSSSGEFARLSCLHSTPGAGSASIHAIVNFGCRETNAGTVASYFPSPVKINVWRFGSVHEGIRMRWSVHEISRYFSVLHASNAMPLVLDLIASASAFRYSGSLILRWSTFAWWIRMCLFSGIGRLSTTCCTRETCTYDWTSLICTSCPLAVTTSMCANDPVVL